MTWFYVFARGNYIGKVHATESALREALGPWLRIETNGRVDVFSMSKGVRS